MNEYMENTEYIDKTKLLKYIDCYRVEYISTLELRKWVRAQSALCLTTDTTNWDETCGDCRCVKCGENLSDPQTSDGKAFRYCPMCGRKVE